MTRKFALMTCFIFGLVMFVQYFSNHPTAKLLNQSILEYWQIIFAFTLIVGIAGFIMNSVRELREGESKIYKLASLGGLILMPLLAMIWGIKADTPFTWIFENVQVPLQATVFSLLAFFVASASFRGFRARSIPAGILLASAIIILISRSSIPGFQFDFLTDFANWLRSNPAMAARRGILIGIGLGSVTTSLRVILGIERTWLGGK